MRILVASQGDFKGLELAPIAPLFLAVGVLAFLGCLFFLIRLIGTRRKVLDFVLFAVLSPSVLVVFGAVKGSRHISRLDRLYAYNSTIPDALWAYVRESPSRLAKSREDEECFFPDFDGWFVKWLAESKKNYPEYRALFDFNEGKLVDPNGKPLLFGSDFDHDGAITIYGKSHRLTDPLNKAAYSHSVGVLLPVDGSPEYHLYYQHD